MVEKDWILPGVLILISALLVLAMIIFGGDSEPATVCLPVGAITICPQT